MNIQKFKYRAPHLIEPLTKCIQHLQLKCDKLEEEAKKFMQNIQDDPYSFNNDVHARKANDNMMKIKSLKLQMKRFKIWLNECEKQSWFYKYNLDENDLSELYQYNFTDLNS